MSNGDSKSSAKGAHPCRDHPFENAVSEADEKFEEKKLGDSSEPCGGEAEPEKKEEKKEEHRVSFTSLESPYFAPCIETNDLGFKITGPLEEVRSLQLVVTSERLPDDEIWSIEVDGRLVKKGSGTVSWDGAVDRHDTLYDGCVSLNMSPYKLRWVLVTTAGTYDSPEEIKVEVHVDEIKLEVDTAPSALGLSGRKKRALENLEKDLKANGGKGRLILESSIFKRKSDEMYDSASFDKYEAYIGQDYGSRDGVATPIFAQVLLKLAKPKGSVTADRSPCAVYGTNVMWDVKVDTGGFAGFLQSERGVHSQARTFLTSSAAVNHQKNASNPPGNTAFQLFGGMRTTRTADIRYWRDVSSAWSTAAFTRNRHWAYYSKCGHESDYPDRDSGIYFVGGRIAGDRHIIRAWVDSESNFDQIDDAKLPSGKPERSNELEVTNWRQIDVARSYKIGKSSSGGSIGATSLNTAALGTEYRKACVLFDDSGLVHDTSEDSKYQTFYKNYIRRKKAQDHTFVKEAALETNPEGHPATFRTFSDYKNTRYKGFVGFFKRIHDFFGSQDFDTYKDECDIIAMRVIQAYARTLPKTEDGLYLVKFAGWGNFYCSSDNLGAMTVGWAPYIQGASSRRRAYFFVFQRSAADDTLVHEVGHQCFLAHAPGSDIPGQTDPAGADKTNHDKNDVCVMSYKNVKNGLCGLCVLKLGGWDAEKIDQDGKLVSGSGP